MIAARLPPAQLPPGARRVAGHRRTVLAPRRKLAREYRHYRIMAKLIVVVEVLIAERNPEYPLAHQRHNLMLDQMRTARVFKTAGKPLRHLHRMIRRPK